MQGRYLRVEYDAAFTGGEYFNVGQFVLIDASLASQVGVPIAFEQRTGFDPIHIVHCCLDELYDHKGKLVN